MLLNSYYSQQGSRVAQKRSQSQQQQAQQQRRCMNDLMSQNLQKDPLPGHLVTTGTLNYKSLQYDRVIVMIVYFEFKLLSMIFWLCFGLCFCVMFRN